MTAHADSLVLIVDDNDLNLRLARDVLRHAGFRTIEARSGAEAIEKASDASPSVVLMDVRLPDMDGIAALDRLRSDTRTAEIPVVALTAFAMMGDRERFVGLGFDGYLEKPISVRTFPDEVAAFCRPREGA
jgi:two-component system, cell cycle response regulator DivK